MNRCTLTSLKLCLFMPAADQLPPSFLINKNYAKEKVLRNFTAMTHPKIQVAQLTRIQVFPAWLIFGSFPDKLLLSSAWSEATGKINTVYFLATEGRFKTTPDYGSTYTFLPSPWWGYTKRKLLFSVYHDETPGKMTRFSELCVHIQYKPLLSIYLEY